MGAQSSAPEETDAAEADADATEDEGASTAETVDEAVSTNATRRLADDYGSKEIRDGFRCHHYDAEDEKFTKEYEWKHCVGMKVGETYEVHWPHSAAGACGTVNQYQTPFYDGVFCNLPMETFLTLGKQDIASAVGVHGQVFTIVNDENYFYSDMIRGMIVDAEMGMGTDVTFYTGSTTGTTRDNDICSTYTPITWQVDRKCHMISASSFDKMCFDMKMQRDDMSDDLYAHGSRELVHHDYAADNHQFGPFERRRKLAGNLCPARTTTEEIPAETVAEPEEFAFLERKDKSSFYDDAEANVCAGAKLALDNKLCADLNVAPQAGSNVTLGYTGNIDMGDIEPNTKDYFASSMCPVNVHWHLGTEHYSVGEYDETGDGPDGNADAPDWAERTRALAEGEVRDGFRCHHYDAEDEKFTKEYEWKHCVGMKVGETYEVHWPHSAAGACSTVNQYQTPFYDGVFCNGNDLVLTSTGFNIGVQAQVFPVVN